MKRALWSFFVMYSLCIRQGLCARILGLFPSNLASHDLVLSPLLEELALRGHNVTVASFFPKVIRSLNYTTVSLVRTKNSTEKLEIGGIGQYTSYLYTNLVLLKGFQDEFSDVLANPKIMALMNDTFDLIITEYFHSELFSGFIYKMKTPFVLFHTTEPLAWHRDVLREPQGPSYLPHALNRRPRQPVTFWWRLVNTLEVACSLLYYNMVIRPRAQKIARDHLGQVPPLDDLTRNASLYLVNTHFSVHGASPKSRTAVEVGGIHLKPRRPLPQDLQTILDNTKEGAIYFSMGSLLHGTSLDRNKRDAVIRTFRKLNQTIIWKWEGDLEKKPVNVHARRWLPQRDILAHSNVVLFISHCGLLSVLEAVNEAVPMLCLPVFADQPFNSRIVESRGFGLSGDLESLNRESYFYEKIKQILEDPSFKLKAFKVSAAFKDRPMTPMDEAVYWVDYVIRHGEAPHLRSDARDLSWVEYHNLDVLAAVFTTVVLCVGLASRIALRLAHRVAMGRVTTKVKVS